MSTRTQRLVRSKFLELDGFHLHPAWGLGFRAERAHGTRPFASEGFTVLPLGCESSIGLDIAARGQGAFQFDTAVTCWSFFAWSSLRPCWRPHMKASGGFGWPHAGSARIATIFSRNLSRCLTDLVGITSNVSRVWLGDIRWHQDGGWYFLKTRCRRHTTRTA